MQGNMMKIDFDEWAALYTLNPEEFERKRKYCIDAEIHKAPIQYRNKLRILQMECDALHNSLSPIEATIGISKLMLNKLYDLQDATIDLKIACDEFSKIQKL